MATKYDDETRRARRESAAGLWEMLNEAGYEQTDMGDGEIWIHGEGQGDCTMWVEDIDGERMLCVGDHLGQNVRYIPAIVAHVLTLMVPDA